MALVKLEDSNWKLPDADFDLRGREVYDAAGGLIGTVAVMMVDTEREEVASVVLADGREIPIRDIEIRDDGVYYLPPATAPGAAPVAAAGVPPTEGALTDREAGAGAAPRVLEYRDYHDEFRQHHADRFRETGRDYDAYEPAYRFGYDMAYDSRFAGRAFEDGEADLRQAYYQRHGYPMSDPHIWADVREAARHAFERIRRI